MDGKRLSWGGEIWQDVLVPQRMEGDLLATKTKWRYMTSIMRRPDQTNVRLMRSSGLGMQ